MKFLFTIFLFSISCIGITAQDIQSMADSNNLFAFKLYAEINKRKTENLFFSPFSISTALAMAYAGARNETERQMSQTLHFNLDQDVFHRQYKSYRDTIETDTSKDLIMEIANSIWVANTCKILSPFSEIVKDDYHSESKSVDFAGNTEQTRQEINSWVEDKTHDKIKDLIAKGMIGETTRLVLVNAIYFKGKWQSPFRQNVTRKDLFSINDSVTDSAKFMNKMWRYKYYKDERIQAIEIPYMGGNISMLILLPNEINGIDKFEKKLDDAYYSKIINSKLYAEINLSLPQFKITLGSVLNTPLSEMGMPAAFSDTADFSGIANERLKIGFVVHKAFINVSEEGTEAAAATDVGMMLLTAAPPRSSIPFIANHPFIFIIKDNATGNILFMGRVTNPAKE